MKILVTGATGFIGTALMRELSTNASASTGRLTATTDWRADLTGIKAVIHTAARVHIMRDTATDPLTEFRAVNVEGTLRLAQQAAQAGVKRFIFLSSIKVNGESTVPGKPFTADDTPAPEDAYGISKHEAEQHLRALAHTTGMEITIIRPPLVYGTGVKGNMALLQKLVATGIPLPFGGISNQRSFVARSNLISLIKTCLTHEAAANQTFLVSDGDDISTPELLRRMAAAMNKPSRLLPIPPTLLQLAGTITGKRAMVQRLCGSLQLDINKTRTLLNWAPPTTMQTALSTAA